MFASIASAMVFGAEGFPIQVEVQVSKGLPGFRMVGRPDETTREARDRGARRVQSSGHRLAERQHHGQPRTVERPQVRFRPRSRLGGRRAIATGAIEPDAVEGLGFVAELGLDGSLRLVAGIVPMVAVLGDVDVVVPAAVRSRPTSPPAGRARLIAHAVRGASPSCEVRRPSPITIRRRSCPRTKPPPPDLTDVHGQPLARRALEIAAAGGHHLLFVGPPGSGKTMLRPPARAAAAASTATRVLAATMVHSAAGAGLPPGGLVAAAHRSGRRTTRRRRSRWSAAGRRTLRPGEVSLAHGGVLFLDELAEFAPAALDALRQPLEEGTVTVEPAPGTPCCRPTSSWSRP